MPGGALANLWVSFAASDPTSDPWTVLYKILGEKGGVSFSWNDAIFADAGGPAWGIVNYVDSFHDQLTHFLDRVIPGRAEPLSTLQDAADALAIVAAAEVSVRQRGAAIPIDYRALG